MKLNTLYAALALSWESDTAFGDWIPEVPDMNQCTVTALVVQDYLGGTLRRCKMESGDYHFWNRLPDKTDIDFTRAQFDYLGDFPVRSEERSYSRNSVLRVKHVRERYERLAFRVKEWLDIIKTVEGWDND